MTKSFCFSFLSLLLGCQNVEQAKIIWQAVPIENTTDRKWEQGWISVRENRTDPSSNFIKLPFILSVAPDSLNKGKTPILIMSGGPGNSSLHMANGVVNTPWGKHSDILVLEQRGTTHARPSLKCPEIDSLRILGLNNGYWGHSLDSLKMQGVKLCYDRITSQGIDLDGYNSLESVNDIEALRKALKIDKIILYGMSYSCSLMAAYAQLYPGNTKAVILDSPLPHQVNYDEEAYRNIDTVLRSVIEEYSGSDGLYDRWKEYISSVKDSVFQITVTTKTYKYTKNELIEIVLFKLSAHNTLSETIPSIEQIISGNHQEVSQVIDANLSRSRQALGMRYSLWIAEELSEEKEEAIDKQKELFSWLGDYPVNNVSFNTKKIWAVQSLYEKRKWPDSRFYGRALILSGQFDPWTPEWYGLKMLDYLPNARHLVYPDHSHLPGFTDKGFHAIKRFVDEIEDETD